MRSSHRVATRSVAAAMTTLALVSGVALAGCSKVAEKATEQMIENQAGGDANVNIDDNGNVSIDTSDGAVQIGNADLPEGWPLPEPNFPDSTLAAAISTNGGFSLNYTSTSDVTEAVSGYVDGLKSDGYAQKSKADLGDMTVWELENDKWNVSVMGGFSEGAGSVQIIVSPV